MRRLTHRTAHRAESCSIAAHKTKLSVESDYTSISPRTYITNITSMSRRNDDAGKSSRAQGKTKASPQESYDLLRHELKLVMSS